MQSLQIHVFLALIFFCQHYIKANKPCTLLDNILDIAQAIITKQFQQILWSMALLDCLKYLFLSNQALFI